MQDSLLFTRDFNAACLANLLLFIAMYIVMPIMPLYLEDRLLAGGISLGAVLASFTLAALALRPFSGFLADKYPGKSLYVLLYALFGCVFCGYFFASSVLMLFLIRFLHGASFSLLTTSSSSLAISIIPRSKLGTGIGFFGMTAALAMAVGPMIGMFVLELFSYEAVFMTACLCIATGFLVGLGIHPPESQEKGVSPTFSWKSLMLPSGYYAFFSFITAIFPYGLFLNYIPLFAREKQAESQVGLLFALVAAGLLISRFFSGKLIDRGYMIRIIIIGKVILFAAFSLFVFSQNIWQFMGATFMIGLGYGMLTPSYQTLFNNLAPARQRGTANSMFFTAFDAGIGSSVLIGGLVAEYSGLSGAFMLGICILVFSIAFFIKKTAPHYDLDKVW